MKKQDLFFELPKDLIAQKPSKKREDARLLIIDRSAYYKNKRWLWHSRFQDIKDMVQPGDLFVVNATRVRPSRVYTVRKTGATVELLILKPIDETSFVALSSHYSRLKVNEVLKVDGRVSIEIVEKLGQGHIRARINNKSVKELIDEFGYTPLPPYIEYRKAQEDFHRSRYQTVYAKDGFSVAAPTAGLHFSERLIDEIKKRGAHFEEVYLDVGPGTFVPVRTEDLNDHKMDSENVNIPNGVIDRIIRTRQRGCRVFFVGTTTVRAIESWKGKDRFSTDLFIRPGYRFRFDFALITNFHLPESTLLCLVFTFCGRKMIMDAYNEAIRSGYRFFSYGDAMLIL